MSDTQSNVTSHFIGRDGFIWWIGQVAPESTWENNKPNKPVDDNSEIDGFGERYRVRIMGYHTCVKDIPDDALPWATVMYPITAGGGGRSSSQNSNIVQGDFVMGFFLDGEQAQQPVILSIIGNNEYNKVLKGLPQDECYIPYEGYTDKDEKVAVYSVTTGGGGEVVEQENSKGQAVNQDQIVAASGNPSIKNEDDKQNKKNGRVEEPLAKPTECEKSPLGAIQKELQNAMQKIQDLKKSQFDSRLSLVLGTAGDIASQIDSVCQSAAEAIAALLKTILDFIMKKILNQTGEKMKEVQSELMPPERPQLRKTTEKILEKIVCLIRKLIDQLLDKAKQFVCDAADKSITAPPCLVQGFASDIAIDALSQAKDAANQGFGEISSIIGGLGGNIGGGLGGIGGGGNFLEEILSFLSCDDEIDCSPVDIWSLWDGPNQSSGFDLGFSGLGGFGFGGSSGSGSGSSGAGGTSANGSQCDSGPQPCTAPKARFIGGGTGAAGNLVVSANGEIMGIDMVSGGSGYTSRTFAIVSDPCGNGGGAVIQPIIDDGEIIDIVVDDPGAGYLPGEDGSKGGDGNKWSDPDDTIIKREDGTYEPPIPPGNVVDLDPGDTIELPPGTEAECIGPDCMQTFRGGVVETVTCPCKITTPFASYDRLRGGYPNLDTGSYPAVLYLCEIRVLETGINYASTDEVIIEPNFGAKATLQTGDQGIVLSVKVTESGEGFTEVPRVYIKTETGINAVLRPKLCIDRVGDDALKEPRLQDKVVSIIDCVGKFDG